ncbi:hypothetical protein EYM_04060 [Ignicoccus islandicus DSM 13165]|uniref:Uncharacterized protein n=1 Tax=Ignicoccus islandicus DSM 13165 TaxID=940295 RepID=A0A0U2MAY8_9CREN|nr:hypothetical protein [Ignicoccus islandicus]ALU12461.1 hypothetical protein EYM_04060 [Ignicoccus islandicus DSM 13165]
MFSKTELEALIASTEKAFRELRERIGNYKYEKGKIGKSEVRLIYKVLNAEGEYLIFIKYREGKVWVEGPRHIAIPLKNRINSLLGRLLEQ